MEKENLLPEIILVVMKTHCLPLPSPNIASYKIMIYPTHLSTKCLDCLITWISTHTEVDVVFLIVWWHNDDVKFIIFFSQNQKISVIQYNFAN